MVSVKFSQAEIVLGGGVLLIINLFQGSEYLITDIFRFQVALFKH